MNANYPFNVVPGQQAVEVGFEPRRGCPLTRFRVLRTSVHHRPPTSLTSTDWRPVVAGERSRTGVNETKTEPRHDSRARSSDELPRGAR
jgi:hypothetical protein